MIMTNPWRLRNLTLFARAPRVLTDWLAARVKLFRIAFCLLCHERQSESIWKRWTSTSRLFVLCLFNPLINFRLLRFICITQQSFWHFCRPLHFAINSQKNIRFLHILFPRALRWLWFASLWERAQTSAFALTFSWHKIQYKILENLTK